MFGNMIRFWVSGFSCEDPILLGFYLQMLNNKTFKPNNETRLRCKYQLKQIYNHKNVATDKKYILLKIGLKFQNFKCNILFEITYFLDM